MPQYIIFSNTDDGTVESGSTSYATAQAGGGFSTNNTNTFVRMGQNDAAGTYFLDDGYFHFDTSSIPTSETIVQSALLLTVVTNYGVTAANDLDIRARTWTPPLTTAQWVSPATLTGLPQVAYAYGAQLASGSQCEFTVDNPAQIIQGGTTYLVGTTAYQLVGRVPTGNEQIDVDSSDASGTVSDPYLLVYTVPRSVLRVVGQCAGQLSTGETVVVVSDGGVSPVLTLGYYAKGSTTLTTIGTPAVGTGASQFNTTGGNDSMILVVDASDNLYVVGLSGASTSTVLAQAFAKGSGLSWTSKTALSQSLAITSSGVESIGADWSNTTASGHIFVWCTHIFQAGWKTYDGNTYATLNCVNLLAESGALFTANGQCTFLTNHSQYDGLAHVSVAALGVGGLSLAVALEYNGPAGPLMGTYVITLSSSGGISTTVVGASYYVITGTAGAETRVCIVPISSTQWVIIWGAGTGAYAILVDNTNVSSEVTAGAIGTRPDMGLTGNWDAVYDPSSGNIWLYFVSSGAARTLQRVSFAVPTKTWGTTATTVSAAVGPTGSTNTGVRLPLRIIDERYVAIETANISSGGAYSTVVTADSFNVAPNAPTLSSRPGFDATGSAVFAWTFSDNNPKDSQLKYELEIDNNSTGLSAYRSGVITSGVQTITLSAGTLSNGLTYRWRVRTYDQLAAQGAFSGYNTFGTSTTGNVAITTPATDNQAENTSAITFAWTYTSSGPTQTAYSLTVVRLSDGATLQTLAASSTATSITVSGLPSGVPMRFDLTITNSNSQTTPAVSRLVTTTYSSPTAITSLVVSPVASHLQLLWTVPTPVGSAPTTSTIDVFRGTTDLDTGVYYWTLIANIPGSSTQYNDYTVAAGQSYDYVLRQNASSGYSWSNYDNANIVTFFGTIVNAFDTASPTAPWDTTVYFFYGGPVVTETADVSATALIIAGRAYPIMEFGDTGDGGIQVQNMLVPLLGNPTDSSLVTYESALALCASLKEQMFNRSTICFRDGRGRRMFGTLSGVQLQDQDGQWQVQFNVTRVDFAEGPTQLTVGS